MKKESFRGKSKKENKRDFKKFDMNVEEREDLIIGRNAVMEVVKGNRTVEALYIAKGPMEGSINTIIKIVATMIKATKIKNTVSLFIAPFFLIIQTS